MRNGKIAVIDDDEKLLGEMEEILQKGGYEPVTIKDDFSAIDTVIRNKPDVILMELQMSNENGFELIDDINRAFANKRIPIIAMSSFFQDDFSWLLDLCGIRRWLKKPFQPNEVILAIENEIEGCN